MRAGGRPEAMAPRAGDSRRASAATGRLPSPRSLWRLAPYLVALYVLLCLKVASAFPSNLPGGIFAERVFQTEPSTDFLWISATDVIVGHKRGTVSLFRNGNLIARMLDISGRVAPAAGDRGLMGMALDPDFWRGRPYVYIGYTADPQHNGGMNYNMVSRFTFRNNALQDERQLLGSSCRMDGSFQWDANCSPMPGNTHAIGSLWMPGDGALWISVGEGNIHDGDFWTTGKYSYVGSDRALAMDPAFLGGKILRINPDNGAGISNNPFCDGALFGARCKVWAVGLRNPFRCTGNVNQAWCGDVGWFTWESLKYIGRGENTGWPCYEGSMVPPFGNPGTAICQRVYSGSHPYPAVRRNVPFQWNHNGGSAAAVGGAQIPSYYPGVGGRRIIADFTSGTVWTVGAAGGGSSVFFYGGEGPVSFRVGMDGWLYYMSFQAGAGSSLIRFRIPGFTPPANPTSPRMTTSARPIPTTTRPPPDPLCNPTGTKRITVPTCSVATGSRPMDPIMLVSREGWPSSRVRFIRNGQWGPVGLDASVGPRGNVSMGRTMGIGNITYITGYGTHAWSQIQLDIGRCCHRFSAMIGVDDEVRRYYTPFGLNVTGEWSITGVENSRMLYNSTTSLGGRLLQFGQRAVKVDIRNLQSLRAIRLSAQVPRRFPTPNYNQFTPAHLNWAEAKLYCGPNSPYAPTIDMVDPPLGAIVRPGTRVNFKGFARAWDGSTIPKAQLQWDMLLVHCEGNLCHQHDAGRYKGVTMGSFPTESHDDGSGQYYFYVVQLRAQDRCGNYDFVRRSILMQGYTDKY